MTHNLEFSNILWNVIQSYEHYAINYKRPHQHVYNKQTGLAVACPL